MRLVVAKQAKFLVKSSNVRQVMMSVWETVNKGLMRGDVIVTLGRPGRSRIQEEKYHAMIGDIARQVEVIGRKYDSEVWKALLVDQYEMELHGLSERLSHPSATIISLDGKRAVTIRASTARFKKAEAAGFIEYLFSFGAENKVVWSDPETKSLALASMERKNDNDKR